MGHESQWNGWTSERRRRQSRLDPTLDAVAVLHGLETAEGKRRVGENAYKGGIRATLRALRRALRKQKKALALL